MKTDFKVYPRKIHVWVRQNSNVPDSEYKGGLNYLWSTNAHKTCRDAVASAKALHPNFEFVANFAKD
jgi:hypothetical protein